MPEDAEQTPQLNGDNADAAAVFQKSYHHIF